MVAVKSHEADRFLARDLAGFSLFLVFGADAGLVRERAQGLLNALVDDPADPFQMVRLQGDDVARDPGRLADEAGTIPLFGGRRAIHLEAGSKNVAPAVETVLGLASLSPVVVEAAVLKKDAALRKSVERAKTAVAIECNPDEERDLLRLIDEDVGRAGLTIAPDARQMMASLLGADRRASRAELEKLVLFARHDGAITIDHIEAVVADASVLMVDEAVDAAFAGDAAALDHSLRKLVTGSTEAGQVLVAALRHANWLHRMKLDLAQGGSADAVLGQLSRYGISFKRKGAIERQLRVASADLLMRTAMRLGEAVGQARRQPDLAPSLAGRTLMAVSAAMGGAAKRKL